MERICKTISVIVKHNLDKLAHFLLVKVDANVLMDMVGMVTNVSTACLKDLMAVMT